MKAKVKVRLKMLHSVTGTTMLVPAELVDEYTAAGHKVALPKDIPADAPKRESKKPRK